MVTCALAGEPHLADGASLDLRMVHQKTNREIARKTIPDLLAAGRIEFAIPMVRAPYGCSELRAVLTDRHGVRHPIDILLDQSPGMPRWLGNSEGVDRDVPPPWTPLKLARSGRDSRVVVQCWGRKLEFDKRSLLKRITASGASVLASPVRLAVRVNGRNLRWTFGSLQVLHQSPGTILLEHSFTGRGLAALIHTTIDFDGCIQYGCSITVRRRVRLDGLALVIPVPRACARYYYYYPGQWGATTHTGALPARGLRLSFRPFIWLGNEDRGISWFTESDRYGSSRGPDLPIRITPERHRVDLRIPLISMPIQLLPPDPLASDFCGPEGLVATADTTRDEKSHLPVARSLAFRFGMQATPVKPVTTDAWDHRIFCIQQKTPGFRPRLNVADALLDRLAKAGVKTVVLFEHWTDNEGHTTTAHSVQLKRIVKACHRRGLKVLLYFGFLISDRAPEWRAFGKDCLVVPKRGYPIYHYAPQPDQSAWVVCLRSAWQDLLIDGIRRVMQQFDVDGVYLDGTASPWGCSNTFHGCGNVRLDGSIGPSYPILAVRDTMRRIYNVIRSHKLDGQINVHNSTVMTIPTLSWATSTWDGEQFAGLRGKEVHRKDLFTLDAFRAEFMGHQWGVPAEFLCYGEPFSYRAIWGVTLLHDVPVRPMNPGDELELASRLWRIMETFGRKEARWFPYWRNASHVGVSPPGAYVSFYAHPRNGLLVVVSNLRDAPATVSLRFDCEKLGLASDEILVWDALTNRRLPGHPDQISVPLPPFGWCILLAQAGNLVDASFVEGVRQRKSRQDQPSTGAAHTS